MTKRYSVFKIDNMYGVSDDIANYTLAWDTSKTIMVTLCDKLNEQEEQITTLTRKLTDITKGNNELIHLIEDYCEKHYDTMNLQSKTDFGKILEYLGWEKKYDE